MNYLVLINTLTGNNFINLYYIDLTKKNLLTKNLLILRSNDKTSITNLLKNTYSIDIKIDILTYYDEIPEINELNFEDDTLKKIISNIEDDKLKDIDKFNITGVSKEEYEFSGRKSTKTENPIINNFSYFIIIQKNTRCASRSF